MYLRVQPQNIKMIFKISTKIKIDFCFKNHFPVNLYEKKKTYFVSLLSPPQEKLWCEPRVSNLSGVIWI